MDFKGSRTQANLMAAFAGESQARNKYTYYASKAKKEGYEQIAAIFTETADNEKEHAKMWFKELHDGAVPSTVENLRDAAAGENYEWTEMYREFAEVAREEGFDRIASLFELVGSIERSTRSATTHCSGISRRASFSSAAKRSSGYAATAVTSMSASLRPRSAPPARIRRLTSKSKRQTIDKHVRLCPPSRGRSFLFPECGQKSNNTENTRFIWSFFTKNLH